MYIICIIMIILLIIGCGYLYLEYIYRQHTKSFVTCLRCHCRHFTKSYLICKECSRIKDESILNKSHKYCCKKYTEYYVLCSECHSIKTIVSEGYSMFTKH